MDPRITAAEARLGVPVAEERAEKGSDSWRNVMRCGG
jgi:hypothetical protein